MKKVKISLLFLSLLILASGCLMIAQVHKGGTIIVPESSKFRPEDAGIRAHTNHLIYLPPQPDSSQPTGETPASLGCVYGLVSNPVSGCPKTGSTSNPSGGQGVIVIVDAFHNPSAEADLETFSTTFGLPQAKFHTEFAGGGGVPPQDCGWNEEESLERPVGTCDGSGCGNRAGRSAVELSE